MNIFQVHEIINIAMAVNGFSQRQAPPDLPTVFVKMSGHIALIMIRVYEHGWSMVVLINLLKSKIKSHI